MEHAFDSRFGQHLCDSIARELGFVCSFMGVGGIIVASSARERIGNTHAVAARIMAGEMSQKAVTAEEAARSNGVREGLNIAIDLDGVRLASFAIAGALDKVEPLAHVMSQFVILVMRVQFADKARLAHVAAQVDRADQAVTTAFSAAEGGEAAVNALMAATSLISLFIEQIRSVARMTNMLALYARIEAARVGDAGQGFAVVATEVKSLSNRSATSTEEITRQVGQVQLAAKGVIGSFSAVSKSVGFLKSSIAQIAATMATAETLENGAATAPAFDPTFGQELCDMVAGRLGYVCSFMGERGVIVASSARDRIGNIHAVAASIMAGEIDERAVTAEEAATSEGMREGYSVGIDLGGVRVVNFGIGGPLAEVTPLARVISRFVTSVLGSRSADSVRNLWVSQQIETTTQFASDAERDAKDAIDTVGLLTEAISQIGHITGQIRDIAEQTNLLALNATIEASRAGAAGRGFAVVANEVKTLSKQAGEATFDIHRQISLIEQETRTVHEAISAVSRSVHEITTQVARMAA